MTAKRVTAVAIAVLFGVTSFACLISAEEDEGAPLMITTPSGDEPISCAVFFADNMVYAPQWRLDNYVRIEVMVIDMTEFASALDIPTSATDLYPSDAIPTALDQQAAIIADSENILPLTKMVSVSYIEVTITSTVHDDIVLSAGWNPVTGEKLIDEGFGREVNKAGHVIYGTLWDTTGLPEGVYTTDVRLGRLVVDEGGGYTVSLNEWYTVDYAIAHLYNPEGEEGELMNPGFPYSDLVGYDHPDYTVFKIGAGGVEGDCAWCELGPLIPQGSGGGNGGGGNGGDGGDGNGHGGENGGGNSWGGENTGGNGHGGKLYRSRSK